MRRKRLALRWYNHCALYATYNFPPFVYFNSFLTPFYSKLKVSPIPISARYLLLRCNSLRFWQKVIPEQHTGNTKCLRNNGQTLPVDPGNPGFPGCPAGALTQPAPDNKQCSLGCMHLYALSYLFCDLHKYTCN